MISNCSQCQYFDHKPNHKNDIRCAIAPAYTSMWQKLKSLDRVTLDSIPVDSCRDFYLDSRLEQKEISLPLTWKQWQKFILKQESTETIKAIRDTIKDKIFQHSLSLSIEHWKAIANSSDDSDVLSTLALHGIEPEEKRWHEVDSSCIEAICFDRSQSFLYIRFHSQSVYQYRNFNFDMFQDFLDASSKGQFFHTYIREQFPYRLYA